MTDRLSVHYPESEPEQPKQTNPNLLGDEETPRSDYDPRKVHTFRRRLALGMAAAVATIGTGVFAVTRTAGAEHAPESRPPSAGAGLAPGETASEPAPASTEVTEPSPEAIVENMNDWDLNTFEYDVEKNKTVKGVEELEEAYGISVEKYPTGEAAAAQFMKTINIWINSITTKAANTRYAGYDGKNQLVRSGGIAKDLAGEAWGEVLTSDDLSEGEGGVVDPLAMVTMLTGVHVQNIQDAAKQRNGGGEDNYHAGYVVNNLDVHTVYQGEVGFTADTTFEGPNKNEDVAMHITLKQVKGADGNKYWKAISYIDN